MKSFSSRSRSLAGSSTAGPSPFAWTPERSAATMKGSTSQLANAATRPSKPGRRFSHSSTVRFGFGFLSLLSTRGSANAREHLVVARVGEPEAVRDPHAAPARRVAEDLALAGDDRPDEGQQRLAPRLRRRTIETRRERLRLRDAAVLLGVERGVVAAEHLLPAEAVEGHDQDVVDAAPAGRLGARSLVHGARASHAAAAIATRPMPSDPPRPARLAPRGAPHASCSSFISAAFSVLHSASSRARVGRPTALSFAWPTSSR